MLVLKNIIPYEYQNDLVERAIASASQWRVVCVQAPTGAGKTVMFSIIADRYFKRTQKSVIILVHREELLEQTRQTIVNMFGINPTLIVAGTRSIRQSPIYIGMIESVVNRAHYMQEVGLVIIDEAHNAVFSKAINLFNNEIIMGFTATPKSSQKKFPMNSMYKDIVCGPQIQELIGIHRLAQNYTRCPSDVVDTTKLAIVAGEYDMFQMGQEYINPKYVLNTWLYYTKYAIGKKTIIFNVNVDHSLSVTECFNFMGERFGIQCKHVDGNTPSKERKEIFDWFAATDNAVLCNVGIATMGFDEPTIRCVVVNRATTSMPLWLQMAGRGGRFIDGEKDSFELVDMGGNYMRHGDWNDDRDWKYVFNNPEKPPTGLGVAPTKICPECFGLVHAATVVCRLPKVTGEECGHVFDRKKFDEQKNLGDLILVTRNLNPEALIKIHNKRDDYFVLFQMGRDIVTTIQEKKIWPDKPLVEELLSNYYEKTKQWHTIKFPEKPFTEKYHFNLAKQFLRKEIQSKFKGCQI